MLRVAVIGYGYWGPNLVRNFYELPTAEVVTVCDTRPERLESVRVRYPTVQVTTEYAEVLADKRIDAVLIATPVSSHFDLAMQALAAGKHLFVEKPLTGSADEAARLVEEADRRKRVCMVDHTFIYTGAVRKIQEVIAGGQFGQVYYYDSSRINLGLFQHDINVVWDLAVHDLSIMDYLLPHRARAVSATGISHIPGEPENTAFLTVFFEGPLIAHVHVNWLAPVKLRRTVIGGSEKMIVYDDLEPSEKVKVYDKGVTISKDPEEVHKHLISYRTGDMWCPKVPQVEALRTEAAHFVECIEQSKTPETDGQAGLRVVRILEAASQSIRENGRPIEL